MGGVLGTVFTLGLRAGAPGLVKVYSKREGTLQAVPVNFFQIKKSFYAEFLDQLHAGSILATEKKERKGKQPHIPVPARPTDKLSSAVLIKHLALAGESI